jgi:hypothetical protein
MVMFSLIEATFSVTKSPTVLLGSLTNRGGGLPQMFEIEINAGFAALAFFSRQSGRSLGGGERKSGGGAALQNGNQREFQAFFNS